MKKILIVLFLISILITPAFAQEEIISPDNIPNSAVSIFSVGDGKAGICSGVVLMNGLHSSAVLTAKHCIDTYEEVYVENVIVKSIVVSVDDDLALLILYEYIPNKKETVLAINNPSIGDIIYHIGYPSITGEYLRYGNIVRQTNDHMYAEMNIISGCSGGGVWNQNGELIGIVWGGLGVGGFHSSKSFAIFEPISDIYKFLNTLF